MNKMQIIKIFFIGMGLLVLPQCTLEEGFELEIALESDEIILNNTNLALNRPVVASSTYCVGTGLHCYSTNRVTDGNTSTGLGGYYSWTNEDPLSQGNPNEGISILLASEQTVGRIEIYTSQGYPIKKYRVFYEAPFDPNDPFGLELVELFVIDNNTSLHRTHTFPPVRTNKIYISGEKGPDLQPQYVRINEVQVFAN